MVPTGTKGIEDPLRPGSHDTATQCVKAGVAAKTRTGDNVLTVRSIATQCGIYTAGGTTMEGRAFQWLNKRELQEIVPCPQVHEP